MTVIDYQTWLDSINAKAQRYSILFLQLGACNVPARRRLTDSAANRVGLDEYLSEPLSDSPSVLYIDGVEKLLDGAGPTMLGPLRDRVVQDVDSGLRVVLVSRAPRVAFPQVPGSSLLEDARFAHGPDSMASRPELYPTCVEDGIDPEEVVRSALLELGPDVCASLDRAIFESMRAGTDAFMNLSARELEALDGAGLSSVRNSKRYWNLQKHLNPLKSALSEVMAADVSPQPQLGQVSGGLWTIERLIRRTIRTRAITAWGNNWRVQCLNADLKEKVLDRAAESAYHAARSVKELRDPLEWLTLGELLDLRSRPEIGNLGLKPALWRQFASQILPVRNRLSHMRTLRPQDSEEVQKWLLVVERKLTSDG